MRYRDWFDDPEGSFLGWAEDHGYSQRTAKTYQAVFMAFRAHLVDLGIQLDMVTPSIISDYLASRGLMEKTKERYIWLLSDIYADMQGSGAVLENPAEILKQRRKRQLRGRASKRLPVALSDSETVTLLNALKESPPTFRYQREKCAIYLLLGCGLRTSELCTLRVEDIHLDDELPWLAVIGKGDKERQVPIPEEVVFVLLDFMDQRGKEPGHFLCSKKTQTALTQSGIYRLVKRTMQRAGIVKQRMSPHVLRHTFATRQLLDGKPLAVVKAWMGHETIASTAIYDHVVSARSGVRPAL